MELLLLAAYFWREGTLGERVATVEKKEPRVFARAAFPTKKLSRARVMMMQPPKTEALSLSQLFFSFLWQPMHF